MMKMDSNISNYGVFDLPLLATAKDLSMKLYVTDAFSAWPAIPLLPEDRALWPEFGLEFVPGSMRPDAPGLYAAAAAGDVELGKNLSLMSLHHVLFFCLA
jgi:hypothetical protein